MQNKNRFQKHFAKRCVLVYTGPRQTLLKCFTLHFKKKQKVKENICRAQHARNVSETFSTMKHGLKTDDSYNVI